MKLLRFAVFLFVSTGLTPWPRYALSAQEAEKQKHRILAEYGLKQEEFLAQFRAAQYVESIKTAQIALELAISIWGLESPPAARWHNNLGVCYDKSREFRKALNHHEEALRIRLAHPEIGPEHSDTALSYQNIGTVHYSLGQVEVAKDYTKRAIALREARGEKRSTDLNLARSYANLAIMLGRQDGVQKVDILRKALRIRTSNPQTGRDHHETALDLNNLCVALSELGDHANAITHCQEALDIRERLPDIGPNHPETAKSHQNLGAEYHYLAINEKALSHHHRALKIRFDNNAIGPNHIDTATSHTHLGIVLRDNGDIEGSIQHLQASQQIVTRLYPRADALGLAATNLTAIGNAHRSLGNYREALRYHEMAFNAAQGVLEMREHATFHNNLCIARRDLGEYAEAIRECQRAVQIWVKYEGQNHSMTAIGYGNLGTAYRLTGEFEKALFWHQKELNIYQESPSFGPGHPSTANAYASMGVLWRAAGDLDRAIESHRKALDIRLRHKDIGPNHPDTANSHNSLCLALLLQGKPHEAQTHCKLALDIRLRHRAIGARHNDVSYTYKNLGLTYQMLRKYDEALLHMESAYENRKKDPALGPDHPDTAETLFLLGDVHLSKGDLNAARTCFSHGFRILKVSNNSEMILSYLPNYARFLSNQREFKLSREVYDFTLQRLLGARMDTSGEKSSFTARHITIFREAISFEISQKNHAKAFEYDSLRRGLSLAEALSLKDALAQGGVTPAEQKQMLDLASEIESLRAQQAAALNRGKKEKADELLQQIFAKERQKDELDQKLTKTYPKYGEIRFPKAPSVESIQKNLRDDEIFISYLISTEKSLAFVVDKKKGLRVVNLSLDTISPEEKSLRGGDSKINRWAGSHALKISNYQTLYTGDTKANILPIPTKDGVIYWNSGAQEGKYDIDKDFNVTTIVHRRDRGMQSELANKTQFEKIAIGKAGDALTPEQIKAEREKLRVEIYKSFVAPIQKEYPSAKNWVVSPDGALYYLPFHLLSSAKLKMPEITLVHSAVVWQKLRSSERKAAPKTLLAFGNAVYSSGHSDVRGPVRGQRRAPAADAEKRLGKMRIYGSQDTTELKWDNLSGTGEEVKGIATLAYSDGKDKEANIHTGVAANVDRVLTLKEEKQLGDYKYIHFAVHGLFVDGNPALNALVMTQPEQAKKHKADEYASYTKNSPLKSDGYLRAGDISSLSLNAELVVMSACETSLGHEVGGEGMVALPQSFLTAGARSVVASLWSVDDAATSLFMQRFYKYLLTDKKKPKEALAATQRDFREHKEFQQYRDPFYWAAFVIYGE